MTTDAMREVLVVVPTLNEAGTIEGVLHALGEDPPPGARLTIVVADGGSRDATVPIVERIARADPAVRLMANPRRLQSAAVNRAAREFGSDAEVLVRCDAHARYPSGYLRRLLETLAHTGADSVVVAMDSHGTSCFQKAVAWASNAPVGTGGSAHRGGRRSGFVDHGHHAAFRMATFRRAGGYDEGFSHNEDAELDCRQRSLGAKIYLDAEIRIGYSPRSTVLVLMRQYYAYGRGRSRTVRRHRGSMRWRQLALPLHLVALVLAVALTPLAPIVLVWPATYLAVLALASLATAWRERSPCGLLVGGAAGLMHLSWAVGFLWGLASIREHAWDRGAAAPLGTGIGGAVPE
jgi:succinoglycan biosynthesis protein ExoA